MCVYIGAEVLLANLLLYNLSITPKDIELYCEQLKENFRNKTNITSLYIDSNNQSLEYALIRYKDEFRKFQGTFYQNQTINIRHFNDRFDEKISLILKETAQNIK